MTAGAHKTARLKSALHGESSRWLSAKGGRIERASIGEARGGVNVWGQRRPERPLPNPLDPCFNARMTARVDRPDITPPPARAGTVRLLFLIALAIAVLGVVFSGVWRHITLADLATGRIALLAFVAAHPVSSVALYVGAYTAVVGLSIPGALVMSLSGGLLFGPVEGGLAAIAGVTSGASLMYLAARSAFGDLLRRLVPESDLRSRLEAAVRRDAFAVLLTLRLMPAAPIVMVNLIAGFVRVPFGTYLAATLIGVAPATFLYAWVGSGLNRLVADGSVPDPARLLDWRLYIPLTGLALLSGASLMWRWRRASLPKAASSSNPPLH